MAENPQKQSNIRIAAQTARDAASLGKAAANAASGNAVGAVKEVAKNPGIFVKIIVGILLFFSLTIFCVASIPSMAWSAVQGFVVSAFSDEATEGDDPNTETFADAHDYVDPNYQDETHTTQKGDGIPKSKGFFASLWGKITSFFVGDDEANESFDLTEDGVASGLYEASQKRNLNDLIDRTTQRYLDRYYVLLDEIKKDSAARRGGYDVYTVTIVTPYPEMQERTFVDLLFKHEPNSSFFTQESNRVASVKLLSAYTVQHNGALGNEIRWEGYSNWLGAEKVKAGGHVVGGPKETTYHVNGWLTDCKNWTGTYMKQADYEKAVAAMLQAEKDSEDPNSFDREKWWNEEMPEEFREKQCSILNDFLKHDPSGPSITTWSETHETKDEEGKVISSTTTTYCDAVYTIIRGDARDVKSLMEFHSSSEGTADATNGSIDPETGLPVENAANEQEGGDAP